MKGVDRSFRLICFFLPWPTFFPYKRKSYFCGQMLLLWSNFGATIHEKCYFCGQYLLLWSMLLLWSKNWPQKLLLTTVVTLTTEVKVTTVVTIPQLNFIFYSRSEANSDEVEAVIFDMTLKLDLTLKSIMDKLPSKMTLKRKRLTRVRKIILRWLGRFNTMETKRKCFTTLTNLSVVKLKG